jgi:hypothetical protein
MENGDILLAYSTGRISLITVATALNVDPRGVFTLMRAAGLPFPALDEEMITGQSQACLDFFREALKVA